MFLYTTAVVTAVTLVAVNALEVPPEICMSMIPQHPAPPQASPPPYTITPSKATVKPGNSIQVIIKSMAPYVKMRNIYLQARQGDKIVGKWTINSNDPVGQLADCGEQGNTVTHKGHHPDLDSDTVAYLWTAPNDITGEVKFRASIIQSFVIFWVGIESPPVKITQ